MDIRYWFVNNYKPKQFGFMNLKDIYNHFCRQNGTDLSLRQFQSRLIKEVLPTVENAPGQYYVNGDLHLTHWASIDG